MNIWNRYIHYLKNNPDRYWFKRKIFGWGWTPATWEGWLTIAIALGAILLIAGTAGDIPESDVVRRVLIPVFIVIGLLIGIAYWKGEKPKWMWGIPKEDTEKDM